MTTTSSLSDTSSSIAIRGYDEWRHGSRRHKYVLCERRKNCKCVYYRKRVCCVLAFLITLHTYPIYAHIKSKLGLKDDVLFCHDFSKCAWTEDGTYVTESGRYVNPRDYGFTDFEALKIPVEGTLQFQRGYFLRHVPEASLEGPPIGDPSAVNNFNSARVSDSINRPTIIWFYDIGATCGQQLRVMANVAKRFKVNLVCLDYQGQGASSGIPTDESVRADARRAVKHVSKLLKNKKSDIFVFGHILGAHAALEVVSHPETRDLVKGAILSSPACSAVTVTKAATLCPEYFIKWSIPNTFESVSRAEATNKPLLILAPTKNEYCPVEHMSEITKAAKYAQKTTVVIEGAGHANPFEYVDELSPSFTDIVGRFLDGAQASKDVNHHLDAPARISRLVKEGLHSTSEEELAAPNTCQSDKPPSVIQTAYHTVADRLAAWKELIASQFAKEQGSGDGSLKTARDVVEVACDCSSASESQSEDSACAPKRQINAVVTAHAVPTPC